MNEQVKASTQEWLSIASTVADIGIKLLPLLLIAEPDAPNDYQLGPTTWRYVPEAEMGKRLWVKNDASYPVTVAFAKVGEKDGHSVWFSVPATEYAYCDPEFAGFTNGDICVGRADTLGGEVGTIRKTLTSAVRPLGIGVAFRIAVGGSITLGRRPDGNIFAEISMAPPLEISYADFRLRIGDANHKSNEVKGVLKDKPASSSAAAGEPESWEIDIPGSADFDERGLDLFIELVVDQESFNNITSGTASRIRTDCPW